MPGILRRFAGRAGARHRSGRGATGEMSRAALRHVIILSDRYESTVDGSVAARNRRRLMCGARGCLAADRIVPDLGAGRKEHLA